MHLMSNRPDKALAAIVDTAVVLQTARGRSIASYFMVKQGVPAGVISRVLFHPEMCRELTATLDLNALPYPFRQR